VRAVRDTQKTLGDVLGCDTGQILCELYSCGGILWPGKESALIMLLRVARSHETLNFSGRAKC
jgi:hypothetical protein